MAADGAPVARESGCEVRRWGRRQSWRRCSCHGATRHHRHCSSDGEGQGVRRRERRPARAQLQRTWWRPGGDASSEGQAAAAAQPVRKDAGWRQWRKRLERRRRRVLVALGGESAAHAPRLVRDSA